MFKVIYDIGKPYEETYQSEEELEKALKSFYEKNVYQVEDCPFDIFIYNEKDEDISESQFVQEIISNILNEVIKNEM